MKLCHVTPYFHPEFYGSHEAFLSKELAARGHEVTLFTTDQMPRWGGAKGLSSDGLSVGTTEWQGVRIVRIPAGPTFSFVPSMPSLPGLLRRAEFDSYLSHEVFSLAAFHTARAARRARRPFVLVQHGYHGGRRLAFRLMFRAELALFGRRVIRSADHIVSLTERGRGFLEGLGAAPEKLRVLPTGVDCSAFAPRWEREEDRPFTVGYIGRIEEQKGVGDLLEAFARSATAGAAPLLRFAGTGAATADLRARARELGISDRIEFLGRIPHAEVPAFFASLDVLAAPTREVEPFGIVAVEAAAAGVPIIATAIGGFQETVLDGETGLLIPPSDPAALGSALARLVADPCRTRRLGEAAKMRARSVYDWPSIADQFESLLWPRSADVAQSPAS